MSIQMNSSAEKHCCSNHIINKLHKRFGLFFIFPAYFTLIVIAIILSSGTSKFGRSNIIRYHKRCQKFYHRNKTKDPSHCSTPSFILTCTMSSFVLGILCAIGSALFNGSFAVLFKTEKLVRLAIHPMTFQLYVCGGILLSSGLAVTALPSSFSVVTPWGLVAGGLLVLAVSTSFYAIAEIGVAVAQGIWGGTAMAVSYAWGVAVFQQLPQNPWLSLSGLVLLVMGVLLIALCNTIARDWTRLGASSDYYERIPPLSNQESDNRQNTTTAARAHQTVSSITKTTRQKTKQKTKNRKVKT